MTPEEIRMKALELALKQGPGHPTAVIERAEAFRRFLMGEPAASLRETIVAALDAANVT